MEALEKIDATEEELHGDVAAIQGELAAQLAGYGSAPLPAGPIIPGSGGLIWPVSGAVVSGFGMRWGRMHEGIDIAVPAGTPIRAAASGTVVLLQGEAESGGYGNFTCLDHGGGLQTCYAHQSTFAARPGRASPGRRDRLRRLHGPLLRRSPAFRDAGQRRRRPIRSATSSKRALRAHGRKSQFLVCRTGFSVARWVSEKEANR